MPCSRFLQTLTIAHAVIPLPLSVPSAEGMNAGGYGSLLMNSEQPQGEYGVTVAFLRLVTTLVKVPSDAIILEQLPVTCYYHHLMRGICSEPWLLGVESGQCVPWCLLNGRSLFSRQKVCSES